MLEADRLPFLILASSASRRVQVLFSLSAFNIGCSALATAEPVQGEGGLGVRRFPTDFLL
jgi:hypothetical protein